MLQLLAALSLTLSVAARAASLLGAVPIGPDRWGKKTLVSEDGAHFAQLLEKDGQELWYVDGRKQASAGKGTFIYKKTRWGDPDLDAVMGSDGRLAYGRRVYDRTGQPIGYAVVVGAAQGPTFESIRSITASKSGAHFAYFGHDSAWRVVVDGKVAATQRQPPTELDVDDAGRVVYLAPRDEDGARYMYLNGRALRPWGPENLVLAPGWRSIAGTRKGGYNDEKVIVDDDRSYGPYKRVTDVRFSADGGHVFYEAEGDEGRKVYLDGRPYGPGGLGVNLKSGALLGPARLAWFADKDLYVDGRPTASLDTPISVGAAPAGSHFAAVGYSKKGVAWIVDGALEESGSSILSGARVVFDSPDEYHALTSSGGLISLSCFGFQRIPADASICLQRARKRYKAYDEDDPELQGGMMLRAMKATIKTKQ